MNSLMSLSAVAAEVINDRVNVDGNWGLIGSTVVTGVVIVFLILAILIFFLWAMGKIFQAIESSKAKKAEQKTAVAAPTPTVQPVPAEVYEEDEEDDDEIIAVISAAIAAYGEAEGKQYRISSVKKREKSQRSGWSAAGIADNMRGF